MTRRRILPSILLSPLAIIIAGHAACSGTRTEQSPTTIIERPDESLSGLLTRLVEDEWCLFSGSSAREGREIGFLFDGSVRHRERHLGDVWSLEGTDVEDCSLKVFPGSPSRSQMTVEFTYDNHLDAFVFQGGLARLVLAPRDFDFAGYLQRR